MKNKILALSFSCLVAVSLAGCGRETLIDNKEGNQLVEKAAEETKQCVLNAVKSDFVGSELSLNLEGAANLKISKVGQPDPDTAPTLLTTEIKASAKANAEAQVNLNAKGLREATPTLVGSELYAGGNAELNLSTLVNKEDMGTVSGKVSGAFYTKDQTASAKYDVDLLSKDPSGEYPSKESEEAQVEIPAEINAQVAQGLASFIEALEGNIPEIPTNPDMPNPDEINKITEEFNKYFEGTITTDELIKNLGLTVPEEPGKTIIYTVLENLRDVNIKDYVEYTKLADKKSTTLTSKLNYTKWKDAITKEFLADVENLKLDDASMLEMAKMFLTSATKVLPNEVVLENTISIAKEGYVSGLSFEFAIKGLVNDEMIPQIAVLCHSLEYDISLSGSYNFNLSNEKVECKTLTVNPKPVQ